MNHSMRFVLRGAALAIGLLAAQMAGSQEADAPRTLNTLDVVALENERVRITLALSEAAPEPVVFTVDKPARLSLDLADTQLALGERFKRVAVGKVRSIAAAEAQGRSRIVVELSELTPYTVRTEGNQVIVEIQGGAAGATAATPAAVAAPSQILSVDFRRGEKGEGRVVVKLDDPRAVVDVREDDGRILAQFRNTGIATALQKRLDVLDFATPVKYVDVVQQGRNTTVSLTPVAGSEFEQVAYQAQDLFTLELQPVVEEEMDADTKRREQIFTGERISLSFQNIDVRSLLQIIGDVSGNNVVISDGVKGELAMRLVNVPWDQALDIILKTKGLGMQQQGNVMLIAPLDEIAARAKAEGEANRQQDEGAPLRSEIIQVNYAKAADLAALMKSASNTLLSPRGQVTVDERTNTMLVLETRERLADIRNLVEQLDVPVRQVLIESRIVIANDDFTRTLGTRFGVSAVARNGSNGLVTTSGSAEATDTTVDSFLTNNGFPVDLGSLDQRFNINFPAPVGAGRIGLAILGADYLVDLELSALQAEGRGEVVSTPRVITANAKQASIRQGVDIPYLEASSSGAATITFKEAVLLLNVTPQITPDDRIIMDLQVKNDARGQDVSLGGATAPSIDRREVNTQVLVKNSETVVLGGVFQQTQINSVSKVPLLGDIPLLGYLFRTNSATQNKRELLLFVTPKILADGLKVN